MVTRSGDSPLDDLQWPPPAEAIGSSRWESDDGPVVVLLDHLSVPYFETTPDVQETTLRAIAHRYLVEASNLDIDPRFEIEVSWIQALRPAQGNNEIHFAWMPIDERGGSEIQLPLRSMNASVGSDDHLVVLFATQRIGETFLGSGFGLRVAIRWRELRADKFLVSITGASATLPFGRYKENPLRITSADVQATTDFLFSDASLDRMAGLAGLRPDSIRMTGVRVARMPDGTAVVERQCVGLRSDVNGVDSPYAASVVSEGQFLDDAAEAESLQHRSVLVADAAGDARVFRATPAPTRIRRPRRDDALLDVDRSLEAIAASTNPPLAHPPHLEVIPCPRFVDSDFGAATPLSVPLPNNAPPVVRSNAASAVQPFWHARDLLVRMTAYGLNPSTYFQTINQKIQIAYRSGVSPGPGKDGQSVNARVQPVGWPPKFIGPVPTNQLPVIQIHLSLADRARRNRAVWTPGVMPTPAVPIGIGSDPRWMWHEFGHVLTLASTGELELRFAHSPGDALAAIVGDPELTLAPSQARWRGATFPWVFLARRHDRCVLHGWSWRGTMHRDLAGSRAALFPACKGYKSEQILSTTLFRIYRCLGGDTTLAINPPQPDRNERLRASHYACFLIMQGLKLLGHTMTTPALKPDQFEQALMNADMIVGTWSATYPPLPDPNAQTYARVGGCSTKIIRWSFEAQGLHAPGSGFDFDCPGEPPPVDVYVKSQRPDWDVGMNGAVRYGPGSYVPVSLHWQNSVAAAAPLWQADPAAGIIWRPNANQIDVNVGNRGTSTANGVSVSVWVIAWPSANPPPIWGSSSWQQLSPISPPTQNIAAGQTRTFGPFTFAPPPGRHVIVAIADCSSDKALVKLANHACSFTNTPLADLVAGDNNLGLLVIRSP